MAENQKPKRKRNKPTYRHTQNAMSLTVYSLTGDTIPVSVRKDLEEAVFQIALQNNLVINIALT